MTPASFQGRSAVNKLAPHGLLQAGAVVLMRTATVLLGGPHFTTRLFQQKWEAGGSRPVAASLALLRSPCIQDVGPCPGPSGAGGPPLFILATEPTDYSIYRP